MHLKTDRQFLWQRCNSPSQCRLMGKYARKFAKSVYIHQVAAIALDQIYMQLHELQNIYTTYRWIYTRKISIEVNNTPHKPRGTGIKLRFTDKRQT